MFTINQSGSWITGFCVPSEILGASGYLPLKQSNIQSLKLVTDLECVLEDHDRICLSAFEKLTALSWIAAYTDAHYDELRRTIWRRSSQLKELELEL